MSTNRELLAGVARKVRPLLDRLVFVGGAVVELYFTDPASDRVRPTFDVDTVCDAVSYTALERVGSALRELGFSQSPAEADPPYRWRSGPHVLDVMPADEQVLGFSNRWYSVALERPEWVELEEGLEIQVAPPTVYLASKLAAHAGRGRDDPLTSRDLEDLIALITNRPEIVNEVESADDDLRRWIGEAIAKFIPAERSPDLVSAFVPEVRTVPDLRDVVLNRLDSLRN